MNKYIYETHMHTRQASKCSSTPGRDYISRYIDAGYAGIIITDHFYRGNCCVDRSLPWSEFINIFCSGYEDALNEGIKHNFPVFFGWEEYYAGDEYLIYGLDKQFMLAHPEMPSWTRRQQHDIVRAAGGCVVQAHPFRARSYISTIHLAPQLVDGIEAYNFANERSWDSLAQRYGELLGLPMTGGSDNHHADRMTPDTIAGTAFDAPLSDIHDYVDAILQHKPMSVYTHQPAPEWTPDITPDLPVEWLNADEQPVKMDIKRFLMGER